MRALSAEQARQLLDGAVGDPLEPLYVLAVTTGMRLGELLGLRWGDVSGLDDPLASPQIHVQVALCRTTGGWQLTEPKTDRARRMIALTQRGVSVLRAHRTRQKEQVMAVGRVNWPNHDLIFTDDWGAPLYGGHVTERQLKPLLRRLGLPAIRFHDLRHTAATLLLEQGVHPKIVSEMLGHASIELTLDTYSHVLPSMQALAATKMDEALG
jgi:integrase